MIQGFGDAAGSTAIFSIIGSEFPDQRDEYFGYFESAVGIGLMSGPVIGQLIFNMVGFEQTFYYTALILTIPFIAQIIYVPNTLNRGGVDD